MKHLLRILSLLALSSAALAGNYVGDYVVGDTIYCKFGTVRPSTGASFTLAGSPVVSAYPDNSTTQITAGITLTADFDSVTGMNNLTVVASGGNGYAAGTFYSLVITTGTVDSISVTGQEVCSFSLTKTSALRPTTATRTLTVDASGNGNSNLVNIAGAAVSTSTAQLGVNVVNFGGSAGTFAAGLPAVNTTSWSGSDLATGTGPLPGLGVLDRGTAQSDSTTTGQLRAAATFADSELVGATWLVYSATTGAGQRSSISANVGSTDTATLSPALTTDPTGTHRYEIFAVSPAAGSVSIASGGITAGSFASGAIDATAIATDAIGSAELAATAGTELGTATWATTTRALTELDEDNTTLDINATTIGTATSVGTVNALANNSMTAAAAAADLTTELQSGLATSAALTTHDAKLGTIANLGSGATIAANLTDIEGQTDDIGVAGAGLTAVGTIVRDVVVEDQGTISLGCALAAQLSVLGGDSATSGGNTTFEESTGTETRVTSVVVSAGNRTVTITCPTYP